MMFSEEKMVVRLFSKAAELSDTRLIDDIGDYYNTRNKNQKIIAPYRHKEEILKHVGVNEENDNLYFSCDSSLKHCLLIDTLLTDPIIFVRQSLTTLPADDPKTLRVGWILYKEIGISCSDAPNGVIPFYIE